MPQLLCTPPCPHSESPILTRYVSHLLMPILDAEIHVARCGCRPAYLTLLVSTY